MGNILEKTRGAPPTAKTADSAPSCYRGLTLFLRSAVVVAQDVGELCGNNEDNAQCQFRLARRMEHPAQ